MKTPIKDLWPFLNSQKRKRRITVGGAYLVAQAIKSSKVLGFPELGMEAIYEFEVKDIPVTVAVDVNGESVHRTGPAIWKKRIVLKNI